MPNDDHIIIYRNGYSETENFNYWAYRQGRRLLWLKNKYHIIEYCLAFLDAPNLVSKETLTPDVMMHLIDCGFAGLSHFLKVIPENEIPESIKLYAARKDKYGSILSVLKNPSKDVINAALKTAGQNLVHLHNPTKEQILLGLSHQTDTPWLISKIKKPTVQMQITAVMYDIDAIKYIKKPCEAVKIAAAKSHGLEILYNIKNPSEQVLLTAINHSYFDEKRHFLYFIPHPNHKTSCAINKQIKLVKQAFQEIEKKTEPQSKEHLPLNYWPDDKELSFELKKIKQELFANENTFLTPTR